MTRVRTRVRDFAGGRPFWIDLGHVLFGHPKSDLALDMISDPNRVEPETFRKAFFKCRGCGGIVIVQGAVATALAREHLPEAWVAVDRALAEQEGKA